MSEHLTHIFSGIQDLVTYIKKERLNDYPLVIVHLFAVNEDRKCIQSILNVCDESIPKSIIYDCTVGQTNSENMPEAGAIVLSFTLMESEEPVAFQYALDKMEEDIQAEVVKQKFATLFHNSLDFVYTLGMDGKVIEVNEAFLDNFGGTRNEVIGSISFDFMPPSERSNAKRRMDEAREGKIRTYQFDVENKKGHKQFFYVKEVPIMVNNKAIGLFGIGKNITEQKKVGDQLSQLSYYDSMTDLPNRLMFSNILVDAISRNRKKNWDMGVLLIDIDRFKLINDSLGHYAGDIILKEISMRINGILPPGAYLGRFAGDKFSLLLTKHVSMKEIHKVIRQLNRVICKPIQYEGQEFFVSASIGISMFPEDGSTEQTLMKNADIALNRVKNLGGNTHMFYSNEMNEDAKERLKRESNLRKALANDEFFLCYQPLIDVHSGHLYGSEALIRWNSPEEGFISPADFIPLAEETGLIDEIGNWVLKTACRQNKKWSEKGLGDLAISVNVSPHQLQQPHFASIVKNILSETGMKASNLHLELTENIMVENLSFSVSIMEQLQKMGVKVSIDDFGTGYSSLSYLKNLPIDYLKIDQTFIQQLKEGTSDLAIVEAIIMMGKGLSLQIIAEGVETADQLQLLKEMDCHYAQGYYIDKPLQSEEFEKSFLQSL
ncbi:putative bifunctional diguanylate cyclase/phosphodiesterase [Bacillus sp. 1P06AnD]|uniref:putative bifunctional diguanylate cyclase/phosphodiesterase n=1 Tax=Bacillus sp. 1P06AnD TaxID=3132208 RepID=UPI0039A15A62